MKKAIAVLLLICLFFNSELNSFGACTATHTTNSNTSTKTQVSGEEFGPLQIAIQDLQDALNFIDQGDKKNAVILLKSAKGQLRKISALNKRMVKGMSARLEKAIKSIKKGDDNTFFTAKDEINHVLSELQSL